MSLENNQQAPNGHLNFFLHLGQAKRTYRSGWMLRGVHEPESIADHMYRMSLMAFLAPDHLDRSKCIEMCLVHDIAESIVGDLTPVDPVTKEEKIVLENNAISSLVGMISGHKSSQHIKVLYEEYSAHASPEANYVKSLDLFDMYLQAYEYELLHKTDLSEFFQKAPQFVAETSFFEPQVKEWLRELISLRENKVNLLPYDSNLNTLLKNILLNKNKG